MDAELRLAERQGDVAKLARLRQRAGLCGGCGQSHLTYLVPGGGTTFPRLPCRKVADPKLPLSGDGDWHFSAVHGGAEANIDYPWQTDTETMVTVTDPCGTRVVWCGRAHAKTVTLRRAALMACGYGDLWDNRFGEAKKEAARTQLKQLHQGVVSNWNDYIDQMTVCRATGKLLQDDVTMQMRDQRVVSDIYPE